MIYSASKPTQHGAISIANIVPIHSYLVMCTHGKSTIDCLCCYNVASYIAS